MKRVCFFEQTFVAASRLRFFSSASLFFAAKAVSSTNRRSMAPPHDLQTNKSPLAERTTRAETSLGFFAPPVGTPLHVTRRSDML